MTTETLEPGESIIDPSDELLYRQITPPLFDEESNQPASFAFGPQNCDEGKASYSRSSKVTAQEARDWHCANSPKPSLGVWAVTSSEAQTEPLRCVDDWTDGDQSQIGKMAPGHCYLDFRGFSKPEKRRIRANLLRFALKRGEIPTNKSQDSSDRTD